MLDITIVNWNSGRQLRECLESIASANSSRSRLSRVVIVDNSSWDGSIDGLEDLGLPLSVISNERNRGFAAACNQGAKGSEADYLLFLNPDTRLFVDSLSEPVRFMERAENENIGICGIQLVDERGQVSRTCARFPKPSMFFSKMLGLDRFFPTWFPSHFMTEWDHANTRKVDHVMGSFFLVRRSLFVSLGGFDERFFVYLEDVDFSLRARNLGWLSYYDTGAQAYHRGGGTSEQVKAIRLFYSLRSKILYGRKHFDRLRATVLLLGTILIEPLSRLALAIVCRSVAQATETLAGYGMLWRSLPAILKAARSVR
ncbi:MAG: glycosyltransferase family 2 protein [Planctomycetota bacterium]